MGLAQLDTLRIRRINAVSFFRIIDNLTGQLGNRFRYPADEYRAERRVRKFRAST